MKDKMRYSRFDLLHWKDWGSTYAAPYQQSGGSVMSSALFLQDELALDARWKLQLGIRYDRFDEEGRVLLHWSRTQGLRGHIVPCVESEVCR